MNQVNLRTIPYTYIPEVERAISEECALTGPCSVQAWVDDVCAYVDPPTVDKYGLKNCSPVVYLINNVVYLINIKKHPIKIS